MKGPLAVALGLQVASLVEALAASTIGKIPAVLTGIVGVAYLIHCLRQSIPFEVEKVVEQKVAERTEQLTELVSQFEKQAMTDALTSLLNRRGGEETIGHHIARSMRINTAISFILVDIDHFKKVNDTHGHAIGDLVLSGVAQCIKKILRNSDFAIRWGGEEFLVCAPDTDLMGAITLAEKLRKAIEKLDFDITKVTASFGCAELGHDPFNVALARADVALYFAKSKGRNQVFPTSVYKVLDES